MDYGAFLATKTIRPVSCGITVGDDAIHESLFPFQRALVQWATRRGRAALFCGTGLGKTRMQLEWARLVIGDGRAIILAPLAVGAQTIREARSIGIDAHDLRDDWTPRRGINVVNYDSLHKIDPRGFDAAVLDESSILKNFTGKTRGALIAAFADTPYRLCCTATPAPNDVVELGNHAEFLGIVREIEMRATWFVHDERSWRLKGHAADDFHRWLASWGMFVTMPSDIGFDDDGYDLPRLTIDSVMVPTNVITPGSLFFTGLGGVKDRAAIRKGTVDDRVAAAAAMVNASDRPWIVWCGLNAESAACAAAIDGAIEVTGSQSPEEKERRILAFIDGSARVLVTKPEIAGFGMNFQHCADMAFVGLSDSYETYFQAIRRCWRFGQTRPVRAVVVVADVEAEIPANVRRKEREHEKLSAAMVGAMQAHEREEIGMAERKVDTYEAGVTRGDGWTLYQGDCVDTLRERLPDASIDFSVFSPPFSSLYTYSNSPRDMGNARSDDEFMAHFGFLVADLLRVTKPGRLAAVHVQNVAAMLSRDGFIGVKDLRGDIIRAFQGHGWIFHGEVTIDKCPQAQAIRTKAKSLLFVQKERDSSWLRPALADYIIVFRAPGENAVPIQNDDVTREDWIEWARPVWYGIREAETLQVREAREEKDERHICPLQLGTIERCIRLWSNRGDVVLSPFAGIGSEGYVALSHEREFIGVELKASYAAVAARNLDTAVRKAREGLLFT